MMNDLSQAQVPGADEHVPSRQGLAQRAGSSLFGPPWPPLRQYLRAGSGRR